MTKSRATIVNMIVKGRRCRHLHHSGRRCGNRVFGSNKDAILCTDHRVPCQECSSMLKSFQPKKGWPNGLAQ